VENILSLARRSAAQAEVFLVNVEETPAQFEANRLKHMQSKQSTFVALRLIKEGRLGYAVSTHPDNAAELVEMALETSRFGTTARFEMPLPQSYPEVPLDDPETAAVPLDTMIRLGEAMIERVRRHTPELICEASVSRSTVSVRLINSRGAQAAYRKSVFGLGLEGNLIKGTDMLFVGESLSSGHPLLRPELVADPVIEQLERARQTVTVGTRPLPVILSPNGVASTLAAALMTAFNGKTVLQGASPVGQRLGQPVFDKNLWLWDDATLPYHPSGRPCDDEGIPSQRTPLIEGGTVSHFLYDLQTAALAGTLSTGSASRGRGSLPAPSASAFVIAPGPTSLATMIAGIEEGLLVEFVMGAEQGNVLGGDFSGNILLGYRISGGQVIGRVKDTMISGNVYELLKQVTLSQESRWVGGSLKTPFMLFPAVSVSSQS
jgi:PmbA protein